MFWDIHSDTMAPWIFILAGLVAGVWLSLVLRRGFATRKLKAERRPEGFKLGALALVFVVGVGGGGWWSYSVEQDLDQRDRYIEAELSKRGIELLEVDGNHADVKVQKGKCTAWYEIKGGTYGPDQGRQEWPLSGGARQLTAGCSESLFAPQ